MRIRLRQLRRDERGMSFVFVGLGFMAFFAATTLAIDVGMFMTARSQAQNAADAGALAGATALVFNDFNDRTPGGPAVQSAINTAMANAVMGSAASVQPGDVTFPLGPTGANDRVKVEVFRTSTRSNPVTTLIGPIFGINNVDIWATATAEAAPANAMTCVKPFTIPDRWEENSVPPNNTFDRYDNHGNVLPNADVYYPPTSPQYMGWNAENDKGTTMTIRAGTGNNIEPSFYFSWKMPGASIGANFYEENITGCNPTVISRPYTMTQEPGNMMGPTTTGIDDLIAQDPNAYYDSAAGKVVSSMSPSPRVFPIPMFDPDQYQAGITNGRNATLEMVNWVGFFLLRRSGNNVEGIIVPITGVIDPNAGPAPAGSFPKAIRLVQ
ncbi:MAG TPA: pilus assembly protein TadG-related protein [Vicinamibacterales bacterium]|nr:pilus assembly protein TadG-related protein [Vicinamibacterales bacterium]